MELCSIEQWMGSDRFQYVKRNYTASDIINLRPTLGNMVYPSHHLSKKLWKLYVSKVTHFGSVLQKQLKVATIIWHNYN